MASQALKLPATFGCSWAHGGDRRGLSSSHRGLQADPVGKLRRGACSRARPCSEASGRTPRRWRSFAICWRSCSRRPELPLDQAIRLTGEGVSDTAIDQVCKVMGRRDVAEAWRYCSQAISRTTDLSGGPGACDPLGGDVITALPETLHTIRRDVREPEARAERRLRRDRPGDPLDRVSALRDPRRAFRPRCCRCST